MYTDVPFWLSLVMIVAGLAALAWSSDLFVDGAAKVAKALGISPFVIGMVIIGFGTSAPELCVSVMSGFSGHSNLSLGNAYGSCIFNIAVILGVAVMVFPLVTRPAVTYVAGPGLAAISLFSMFVLRDGSCSRVDAAIFIAAFLVLLPLYCWFDQKTKAVGHGRRKRNAAPSGPEPEENGSIVVAVVKLVVGFSVLVASRTSSSDSPSSPPERPSPSSRAQSRPRAAASTSSCSGTSSAPTSSTCSPSSGSHASSLPSTRSRHTC